MKTAIKVWMYVCTIVVTAYLAVAAVVAVWARFAGDSGRQLLLNPEKRESSADDALISSVFALFRAVENHDNATIYQYAAPEIKERVPYDMFVSHQYPEWEVEEIQYVVQYSAVADDVERAVVIVSYRERGSPRIGAMRWRSDSRGAFYDTLPFGFSLLSDFGYFPRHLVQQDANQLAEATSVEPAENREP